MIAEYSKELGLLAKSANQVCTTAESCTGGLVAGAITDIAGSSSWFEQGFVTYSNLAKAQMLDVSKQTLNSCGAVSQEVALEMARGAIDFSRADFSVAISGIAGPDGGSSEKPVGTVWFGWASRKSPEHNGWSRMHLFKGDRQQVRSQAVEVALRGLIALLNGSIDKFVGDK